MGLAEAAASLSGHESGHLQNAAGQQVKQSFCLLHVFIDSMCTHANASVCILLCFHVYIPILSGVYVFEQSFHEMKARFTEARAASVSSLPVQNEAFTWDS